MGSGEGRENRPRSRHCDRQNAVSQDTFPSLWCWHSSRERVWRCAPFSRGAFFIGGKRTDEIQNQGVLIGLRERRLREDADGRATPPVGSVFLASIWHAGARANTNRKCRVWFAGCCSGFSFVHGRDRPQGGSSNRREAHRVARSEPHGNRVCFRRRRSSGRRHGFL